METNPIDSVVSGVDKLNRPIAEGDVFVDFLRHGGALEVITRNEEVHRDAIVREQVLKQEVFDVPIEGFEQLEEVAATAEHVYERAVLAEVVTPDALEG